MLALTKELPRRPGTLVAANRHMYAGIHRVRPTRLGSGLRAAPAPSLLRLQLRLIRRNEGADLFRHVKEAEPLLLV